jgi:small subunit ribosomal protein S16
MAVHIRLARAGAKKNPFYRLVVADQRSPRGGRFLEKIGTFDPSKKESADGLVLDQARFDYWKSKGAVPSETVARLLKSVARAARAAEAAAK